MRARKIIAGLALVGAIAAPMALTGCSSDQGAAMKHVSVTAFEAEIAKPGTKLIDVRTPGEFAAGHIAGAVNIDVESAGFEQRIAQLDKKAPYSVYCRSGNRSQVALDKMKDAGFTDVEGLEGGIAAWAQAGKPVE